MRCFIGCNVRGEAAEYCKDTCADLATRFGVEDVTAIVPPHITVKAAFDRLSTESLENTVSQVAESPSFPIVLSGWGHFGTRTIFIDAPVTPTELKAFAEGTLGKLKAMGILVSPQEQSFHLHLSIARFLKPDQFDAIWKHLQTIPAPKFDLSFDNLTIFIKENREDKAWKVMKTFPLMGKK